MDKGKSLLILFLAAVLEAGGDAIMRTSLHAPQLLRRILLFALGGCVLTAYGWVVNTPPWDFGKLLGLYVVFFFICAQLISWLGFGQLPSRAVLAGGILIISGGLVITLWES